MKTKSINYSRSPQHLIADLFQKNSNIEFLGVPQTLTVLWYQHGETHEFNDLDPHTFAILANAYGQDRAARAILSRKTEHGKRISFERQVELYTYFMYGGWDDRPDILDGQLQQCENYRHTRECISLKFDKKQIRLSGSPLKPREIQMLDLIEDDLKDEVIAREMHIAKSTYDQHARELRDKAGVHSKTALAIKASRQGIIGRSFNV